MDLPKVLGGYHEPMALRNLTKALYTNIIDEDQGCAFVNAKLQLSFSNSPGSLREEPIPGGDPNTRLNDHVLTESANISH